MLWRDPKYANNIVRDWDRAQGFTNMSDEHIQIRRDVNVRLVTVENSGMRPVGVAITTYYGDPLPKLQFVLQPGEVKSLGINSIGPPLQFLHILDPVNGLRVGHCTSFRTDCNQFVLRDGLQGWTTQAFQRTGFRPAK